MYAVLSTLRVHTSSQFYAYVSVRVCGVWLRYRYRYWYDHE